MVSATAMTAATVRPSRQLIMTETAIPAAAEPMVRRIHPGNRSSLASSPRNVPAAGRRILPPVGPDIPSLVGGSRWNRGGPLRIPGTDNGTGLAAGSVF
jgi:hypothetical protein